ncbi:hypothetical protein R3P38DRAFT_3236942 [Favolaschia claudopus]|uniref:Uncharacterized protein n=1 Tax=Favolaschia claudopus TaxID=2862362 RepID=A0AAV9ZBK3_9AGAR
MFVFKNDTSTGSLGSKTHQLIPCVSFNGYLAPFGFNGHGNAGNDDYEVLQKLWGPVPMWLLRDSGENFEAVGGGMKRN